MNWLGLEVNYIAEEAKTDDKERRQRSLRKKKLMLQSCREGREKGKKTRRYWSVRSNFINGGDCDPRDYALTNNFFYLADVATKLQLDHIFSNKLVAKYTLPPKTSFIYFYLFLNAIIYLNVIIYMQMSVCYFL